MRAGRKVLLAPKVARHRGFLDDQCHNQGAWPHLTVAITSITLRSGQSRRKK
jgi:hypothetical protein